jgi:hypothetical protein
MTAAAPDIAPVASVDGTDIWRRLSGKVFSDARKARLAGERARMADIVATVGADAIIEYATETLSPAFPHASRSDIAGSVRHELMVVFPSLAWVEMADIEPMGHA